MRLHRLPRFAAEVVAVAVAPAAADSPVVVAAAGPVVAIEDSH